MADQIRVLVVDDIPETRDHLTKLLGFESDIDVVGSAASGKEALEMGARLNPDVILMDINMPDMDGITATEQLSSSVPGAAVVMMSVQGEAYYLRRSMLAGAREFLVKPFSSDELTASIRQVYTREQAKISRMAAAPIAGGTTGGGAGGGGGDGDHDGQVVAIFSPKGGDGGRQDGRPRRRLVSVRRRRRPAEPEPEEQVDRGPRPRAGGRRARVARHVHHQSLDRDPGPARPTLAGDGRADHAVGRAPRPRCAPPHP